MQKEQDADLGLPPARTAPLLLLPLLVAATWPLPALDACLCGVEGEPLLPRPGPAAHRGLALRRAACSRRRSQHAVLGAEIVHEPAEAEHLHTESEPSTTKRREEPEPPALAAQAVVHGEPDVRAHVREVHGHGRQDPEAVPQRVAPLLRAQAQAQRRARRSHRPGRPSSRSRRPSRCSRRSSGSSSTASRPGSRRPGRLLVLGPGPRRQADASHRARVVRVLQRGGPPRRCPSSSSASRLT